MVRTKPLVTVIIPTYNRAHSIERATRTVLSQSFPDLEVIIVDDGSTDNTEEIIASMKKDKRIKYLKTPTNQGATHARNMGIEHATGDYIGFQDSDDEWLPTKLQTQVKVLGNSSTEVGVVFTGYWRVMADSRRIYMPIRPPDMNNAMEILLKRFFLFVATPTVLARRQCFSHVGLFDERLSRLQEWELWIRFSQRYRFLYINEPLVLSHYQPESITSNYEALSASFELILAKHRQILEQDRTALAELYNIFGRHLLDSQRTFRIGRDYLWQALKLFPTNPWYLGYFLLSCLNFELLAKTKMAYRSAEHKIRSST